MYALILDIINQNTILTIYTTQIQTYIQISNQKMVLYSICCISKTLLFSGKVDYKTKNVTRKKKEKENQNPTTTKGNTNNPCKLKCTAIRCMNPS